MAGALTPEQQTALIETYHSFENAQDKALERSPRLRKVWQDWWPRTPDFWKAFWKIALPVLGIDAAPQALAGGEKDELKPRQLSTRGRTEASVSETEANKAARIYIKNRELKAYGVWVRYNPRRVKQKTNSGCSART
jgi:hypothetical protein